MAKSHRQAGGRVLSIGHSNHAADTFVALLKAHGVELVADVRSQPYSKYVPQFNGPAVKSLVTGEGVDYLFMGKELGGRPDSEDFYDEDGHVLYDRLAESAVFLEGISRLERELPARRVALMCSEEDPLRCHRYLLIARVLAARGIAMEHIRGDGRLESEADLRAKERAESDDAQLVLFPEAEEPAWRSLRSVSPKRAQPNSLES